MKSFSNPEVLAMLERNANLTFKCKQLGHIYTMKAFANKIFLKNEKGINCGFCLGDVWTLEPTPVTFMEAAKAFENGKNIRCEFLDKDTNKTVVQGWYQVSLTKPGIMAYGCHDITFYKITNGKWFIQEEGEI